MGIDRQAAERPQASPAPEAGEAEARAEAVERIRARLFALRDDGYADFQRKLMPTVDPALVIGVRTPALRALARELAGTADARAFLAELPHRHYEEANLHGMLLERIGDLDELVAALDRFLPHVDNWATCDLMSPKAFKRHVPELPALARHWMASEHPYAVRFGVGVLLGWCLDEGFSPEHLGWVCDLEPGEYYVDMMRAWYFATAFAKQREAVLPVFRERRLDPWTHAKAIQKARESRRVSAEDKELLASLR